MGKMRKRRRSKARRAVAERRSAEFVERAVKARAPERSEGLRALIYPAARLRLSRGSRRLGHDCCAVCGREKRVRGGELVACHDCGRVRYCSRACALTDAPAHFGSCLVLRTSDACEAGGLDKARVVERALRQSTLTWLLGRLSFVRDSWVAALVAAEPKCAELTQLDLSVLSYPLSVALVAFMLKHKQTVLVVGAGRAETDVPTTCWAALSAFVTELCFLGPDVAANKTVKASSLTLEYRRAKFTNADPRYSLVVGFNLGLTCPDYDWSNAPFRDQLRTSNLALFSNTITELRRELDIIRPLASGRPDVFTRNPFHCPLWRQSDTLANDVYRKHSALALFHARAVPRADARFRSPNHFVGA